MLDQERIRRQKMWHHLLSGGGPQNISPHLLRDIGIYGGAQGIWVDKARTSSLTLNGHGVTVGLLHTGEFYPDDLSDTGVIYHYPKTNRPRSRDLGEIEATKNARRLSLPIFVITQPSPASTIRDVFIGWVEEWDDQSQEFLITFLAEGTENLLTQPETETPFIPQVESSTSRTLVKTRPVQQHFNFLVFQRYGEKCAVCNLNIPDLLDAAHLIPKRDQGTDDPRNGLVLCALHHRALDAGLFCFDPVTLQILYRAAGPDAKALQIVRKDLHHLSVLPHKIALHWIYERWK
jgi:putative restriction endonuclease